MRILGIDVSRKKFDAALLSSNGKIKNKVFPNSPEGFDRLIEWLEKQGAGRVHACLESTGVYGEELALALASAGHKVSVVNPARIKGFGQSELSRTKTDKADAALIARFCQALTPEEWTPPPPPVQSLRELARRLEALGGMLQQERNRLDSARSEEVKRSIQAVIAHIEEEMDQIRSAIRGEIDRNPDLRGKRDLLTSIPGVGETTSAILLAEFDSIERFGSARQMAAFAGLVPRLYLSGSSVRGKTRLSKTGSSRIRKALYMPALVAKKHNPLIAAFCERLQLAGKSPMAIIGAAMRKLIHIIYGVLKSGKPFDPAYHKTEKIQYAG